MRWLARLRLDQYQENLAIAMETLRVSKLRSGLTILGVVIGVATVMTMASLVEGLRSQIIRSVEVAGPTTFYVLKAYSSTPVNPDNPPAYIRIRPDLAPGNVLTLGDNGDVCLCEHNSEFASMVPFLGVYTCLCEDIRAWSI